jgi:hypothetical protein
LIGRVPRGHNDWAADIAEKRRSVPSLKILLALQIETQQLLQLIAATRVRLKMESMYEFPPTLRNARLQAILHLLGRQRTEKLFSVTNAMVDEALLGLSLGEVPLQRPS